MAERLPAVGGGSLPPVTDRAGDDDWVRETLARAVLDDEPRSGEPIRPEDGTQPAISSDPGPTAIGDRSGSTGSVTDGPTPGGPTDPPPPDGGDDAGGGGDGDDEAETGSSAIRSIVEWIVVIVGALAMALLLRAVLFQAFWIPSESMEPTLQRDDRVLVNRLSYRLHDVNRGDVVVFSRPPGEPDGGIRDLIKRVVALEGETIEARDGQISIDGQLLLESYVAEGAPIPDFGPIVVPEDHVFVMGDNRNNSRDSRFFSAIDEDSIVGRAFVLFWPLDRIGAL